MADLQEFSKLLDGLKLEVTTLDKQSNDLKQECTTLEARKKFLTKSIGELKEQQDRLLAGDEDRIAEQKYAINENNNHIARLETHITELENIKKQALAKVKTLRESHTESERQLGAQLLAKQAELDEVTELRGQKLKEVEDYNCQITNKKQELDTLSNEVTTKEIEVADRLEYLSNKDIQASKESNSIDKALEKVSVDLTTARTDLNEAQAETENARQQHDIFREYEIRARKKLEARDESLNEREANLAEAIKRAKRSGIVLDTV